jgi:putative transposase
MIDRDHELPLTHQAQQLEISRGSIYYLPRPVSSADLAIMRRIDELHLLYPFAGSRMLRDLLRQEDVSIGRRHVATLMKRMGLEAIYRRPNTSKPAAGHKIYPYLLHKLAVTRPIPKFGRPISRTCPWRAVSSIWSLSSIGLPGGCWLGGRRSQWM